MPTCIRNYPAVGITGNKECAPGVKTARCLLELGSGTHLPLRVRECDEPIRVTGKRDDVMSASGSGIGDRRTISG